MVIAHPAAVVLALLLLRAQKVGNIARAVATVFEPASEHGRRGMDELHEQTVNLLSFQQLPKGVFDAQVAFNLLDRYGEKSLPSLASVESRIQRHFRSIVQGKVAVPSLMLLQAPIFHGHAFSLYIELDNPAPSRRADRRDLRRTRGCAAGCGRIAEQRQCRRTGADPGVCPADAQNPNGFWLWAASDNLRIAALAAVECAENMIASRPRGTVQ